MLSFRLTFKINNHLSKTSIAANKKYYQEKKLLRLSNEIYSGKYISLTQSQTFSVIAEKDEVIRRT